MPETKPAPGSGEKKDLPRSWVKAANPDRVGVSERHPQHPPSDWYPQGGEVFVVGDRVVEVAETPLVLQQLQNKTLVRVSGPAATRQAPEPAPAGPAPGAKKG